MKKKLLGIIIIFCLFAGFVGINSVNAVNNLKQPRSVVNEVENEDENIAVSTKTSVENTEVNEEKDDKGLTNHDIGLLAAALATGLACIGAGIAVAVVASSAVGAISENPGLLGKTIIFAGLAEGIAIYGLIISIMILNKI